MSGVTDYTETSIRARVRRHPAPAARWLAVGVVLLGVEAGAAAHFASTLLVDFVAAIPGVAPPGFLHAAVDVAGDLPTLLSRNVIPNQGYYNGQTYVGTFLGLSPMYAWLVRVAVVYAYAFTVVAWVVAGLVVHRRHYRAADWTPLDDVLGRLRTHYWGLFGLFVVLAFVVMAVFAPTLGPTTVEQNIREPYGHTIQYWDAESGAVEEVSVGVANQNSRSVGNPRLNVEPMTYDDYGRFHPFGTMPSGQDLFTFITAGSRLSLVIGLMAVVLSSGVAVAGALVSAYYKGKVDLGLVVVSDAIMAMPRLLLLIMLTVILSGTWVGGLYGGGLVLGLIFAGTGWPFLWRSFRGPALQVAENEWIDAAKMYGLKPWTIMRKHMLPYILGYVLVYGSMTLGGAIIAIAGLSFLGLGVNAPTPEWGRAVNAGQEYVGTVSWHISFIPGVLITLVVTGFNAFGDGIRDAIDPQSDSAAEEAGGGGQGGGA
jgi:peptide/nickel transport system permease protein